ncbi:MAG: hypothetical protein ACRD2B_09590 [Terriglobia bacterium]
MCDYSLMCVPNRLAKEHENLVMHRFPTGPLGFASSYELEQVNRAMAARCSGFWRKLRNFFAQPDDAQVPAVCVPPGARLKLEGIPRHVQTKWHIGPAEEVTFTQLSAAANTYRDAVRFKHRGHPLLLQELKEGVRANVLDLSLASEYEPHPEEFSRSA